MGLITRQLTETDKFVKPSNECSSCSGTKAVAGMEGTEGNATSVDERGAGTAVDKTAENGKRYVLADGPASNLFTKALQVKFSTGDTSAELNNNRPTEAKIEVENREQEKIKLVSSNESASQDVHMRELRNNAGVMIHDEDLNTSRFRVSRTTGNPRDPVTVNPVHAFKQLADTGIDVDFVMIKSADPNGDEKVDFMYPEIESKNQVSENQAGRVEGMISNENLEIMSVEVIVKYR